MFASLLPPCPTRCSRIIACVVSSLICLSSFALQTDQEHSLISVVDGNGLLKEIGPLPPHIKEASGLEITGAKHLWTHNDGGVPALYCLDTLGNLVRALQLNHRNSGWEDLTVDKKGNLYIGAIGNNNNDKRQLSIYKIPDPEKLTDPVVTGEIIHFTYEDQRDFPPSPPHRNFDADAFIARGDSLFIFSKNRTSPFTGYTKIYRLPQQAGSYQAILSDSIFLGNGSILDNAVTAAALSPDGGTLALLSHRCVWLIKDFNGSKFSSGKIVRVNLHHFSHKAGMCFSGETRLLIVDELEFNMIGGKLYSIDLQKISINPQ